MNLLYAPWREEYDSKYSKNDCVFCYQLAQDRDEEYFILKRFAYSALMLNTYPYNPGHLLIVPYAHGGKLEVLPKLERYELMDVTTQSITLLQNILAVDGINVGLNLGGKAAGGSIPDHVHIHVLPRWLGDTNFLVPLADTKQISANLRTIYQRLKQACDLDW